MLPIVKLTNGAFASYLNQIFCKDKSFVSKIYIHCPFTGNRIDNFKDYSDMLNIWQDKVEQKEYSTVMDHVILVVQYLDSTTCCYLGLDNSARNNEFSLPLTERNNLSLIINKLTEYYPTKIIIAMQEAHRDIFKGNLKENNRVCSFDEFLTTSLESTVVNFVNKGVFAPHENLVGDILIAFGIQVLCSQDIEVNVSSSLILGTPLVNIKFNPDYPDLMIFHNALDFVNTKSENIHLNKGLLCLDKLMKILGNSVCISDANLITEISPKAYDIIGNDYLLNPKIITFLSSYNEIAPDILSHYSIEEHLKSISDEFIVTNNFF